MILPMLCKDIQRVNWKLDNKKLLENIMFYTFLIIVISVLIFVFGKEKKQEKLYIGFHIKGEIMAPGYYELEEGSRYMDALLAAGGETAEADIEAINLSTIIVDGEEIIVPQKASDSPETDGKININTADIYQLCKLDGIGEKTAQKIIDYRSKHGKFNSKKELLNVDGIGDTKFKNIENLIYAE